MNGSFLVFNYRRRPMRAHSLFGNVCLGTLDCKSTEECIPTDLHKRKFAGTVEWKGYIYSGIVVGLGSLEFTIANGSQNTHDLIVLRHAKVLLA
jgi:hypothetical protein